MINLSPEREAELLAYYKAKREAFAKQEAEYATMRADQKKKQIEFWNRVNKPRVVKTTKDHVCVDCQKVIVKGEQAVVKAKLQNVAGSGWTGAFLTSYHCLNCGGVAP